MSKKAQGAAAPASAAAVLQPSEPTQQAAADQAAADQAAADQAAADQAAADAASQDEPGPRVAARMLRAARIDGCDYKADAVVVFPARQAEALRTDGAADPDAGAVGYALSLGASPIEHMPAPALDEAAAA